MGSGRRLAAVDTADDVLDVGLLQGQVGHLVAGQQAGDQLGRADLVPGDVIAVSSTKATTDHVKAFKLIAGVEPFLRMAQMSAGGQRGGRQPQGVQGGFTIPGLDGIGF